MYADVPSRSSRCGSARSRSARARRPLDLAQPDDAPAARGADGPSTAPRRGVRQHARWWDCARLRPRRREGTRAVAGTASVPGGRARAEAGPRSRRAERGGRGAARARARRRARRRAPARAGGVGDPVGVDPRPVQQLVGRARRRHLAHGELVHRRAVVGLGERLEHRVAEAALGPVVLDGDDRAALARGRAAASRRRSA